MLKENLNLTKASTGELWELARCGNREAFMAIYDRYSARIYDYVKQLLKTRIRRTTGDEVEEQAKQVIINVFETLWNRRLSLSKELSVENHLFTSALYAAVNDNARISCQLN